MKNYYEILEVNEKASQDTISKVFKMHMKKWHPDLYQGEEKIVAENKTKELSEAYNILSDENKRKEYDTELSQQNLTTNYEIENLRQENEMLKKDIEKRNLIISNLINPSSETYKKIIYDTLKEENNNNINNNINTNSDNYYYDNYNNQEEYETENNNNVYKQRFYNNAIALLIKLLISSLILIIGCFFIFILLTNIPIFK